jgi:hypothetical protein
MRDWVRTRLTVGVADQHGEFVHDLREVLQVAPGRNALPSAAIVDSHTLQATPESGTRAGYDGAKRRRDSQVHLAVDTLGPLLALPVTAANEQDRSHVHTLAEKVQAVTGGAVELAYVNQGDMGAQAAEMTTSILRVPHPNLVTKTRTNPKHEILPLSSLSPMGCKSSRLPCGYF